MLGGRDHGLHAFEFCRVLLQHLLERPGQVFGGNAGEFGKLVEKTHLRDLRRRRQSVEIVLPGLLGLPNPLLDGLTYLRMIDRLLDLGIESVGCVVAVQACRLGMRFFRCGFTGPRLAGFSRRRLEAIKLGGVRILGQRFGAHRIDARGQRFAGFVLYREFFC